MPAAKGRADARALQMWPRARRCRSASPSRRTTPARASQRDGGGCRGRRAPRPAAHCRRHPCASRPRRRSAGRALSAGSRWCAGSRLRRRRSRWPARRSATSLATPSRRGRLGGSGASRGCWRFAARTMRRPGGPSRRARRVANQRRGCGALAAKAAFRCSLPPRRANARASPRRSPAPSEGRSAPGSGRAIPSAGGERRSPPRGVPGSPPNRRAPA